MKESEMREKEKERGMLVVSIDFWQWELISDDEKFPYWPRRSAP